MADGGKSEQPFDVPLHKAHDRADDGGRGAEDEKNEANVSGKRMEHRLEDRPIDAENTEDSEFHHHPGEEHTDWRRRDRVRIGEPEMEGHDRGFDEEAAGDEDKGHHHKGIGWAARERALELREIERAGAAVKERNSPEGEECADGICDREIEPALDRRGLDFVSGEGECDHAHELEKNEEGEDVAAETKTVHGREKNEHERVKERADRVEITPAKNQRGADQKGRERCKSRAQRVGKPRGGIAIGIAFSIDAAKIGIASATYGIVGFPAIELKNPEQPFIRGEAAS